MEIQKSLIKWAEKQGVWAKFLLAKCFENFDITDSDIENFTSHFLLNNLQNIEEFTLSILPSNKVVLKSLKNINGVNKLAQNQTLEFNKHLTVLYGMNGSGKTGYVRVLKQIGSSLDKNDEILDNLDTDEENEFSADISYLNENNEEFNLHLNTNNKPKLNVKIFNHDCVVFSLKDKKEMLFKPKDFEYFNILSSGITKLTDKARLIQKQNLSNLSLSGYIDGTAVSSAINEILSTGKTNQLDKIYNEYKGINDFDEQIKQCQTKIEQLDVSTLNTKLNNLRKVHNELNNCLITFMTKSKLYSDLFWNEIIEFSSKIKLLENEKVDITLLTDIKNLEEEKQLKLKNLILSVNSYLEVFKEDFTNVKNCPLCKRLIDDNKTKELFNSYSEFAKKDNTKEITLIKSELNKKQDIINNEIMQINTTLTKLEVLNYNNTSLNELKSILTKVDVNNFEELIDFHDIINSIKKEVVSLEDNIKNMESLISVNDNEKTKILNQINELKSFKILIKDYVSTKLSALNIHNIDELTNLNTSSLSSLQRKILISNYQDSFLTNLSNYLKILRAPSNINFETKISSSTFSLNQKYSSCSNNLNDILSEGEQTVVALAHFISENIMQDDDNVLIFDDPVNSLDIERMDIVAKTLVNLSFDKQIIVFTHNLVFLNALNKHVKRLNQFDRTFYHLNRNSTYTGILVEGLPNTQNYRYYRNKANEIYQKAKISQITEMEIKQGYSLVRSSIEVLVVDYIFNGTVKRYDSAIHLDNFTRIKINELKSNYGDIVALFDKCCEYTEAHSSSEHESKQPTIEEFIADFEKLESLFNIFKTNN